MIKAGLEQKSIEDNPPPALPAEGPKARSL
jgi:hypothetical protein